MTIHTIWQITDLFRHRAGQAGRYCCISTVADIQRIFQEHAFGWGQATKIALHYRETSEGLILVFEDNGVGVQDEIKEDIFIRKYEEKKGMGLFLVREILSITGISIKGTGEPGNGARFEIMVPNDMWRKSGEKE